MPARPLLAVLLFLAPAAGEGLRAQDPSLQRLIDRGRHPAIRWARFSDVQADARALYARNGWRHLWLAQTRPTSGAHALLGELATVGDRGLHSEDYDAAQLTALAATLDRGGADAEQALRFDTALTIAALRLVRALRGGRIGGGPRAANVSFEAARAPYDAAATVEQLRGTSDPGGILSALEPEWSHYRVLKRALARYRALARDRAVLRLPRPGGNAVREGGRYAGAARLRRLLADLGDLDPRAAASRTSDSLLTAELCDGIRRFQVRQGSHVDGLLNEATWRQLTTHFVPRIRQMELALERWRWLPREPADPPLLVSLPDRRAHYVVPSETEPIPMSMSVALGTGCPTERPVRAGVLRLLQLRPADRALGSVKLLSGDPSFYLHGSTPHDGPMPETASGCIRVADAVLLAEILLRDRPDWTRGRIQAVLAGAKPVYVRLPKRVPVLVVYATAVARENGQVFFYSDLYGHDRRLEQLLARGYPYNVER